MVSGCSQIDHRGIIATSDYISEAGGSGSDRAAVTPGTGRAMATASEPGIIYALVARGPDVLAEYIPQGVSGNFAQVTRMLLARIGQGQERASYTLDG